MSILFAHLVCLHCSYKQSCNCVIRTVAQSLLVTFLVINLAANNRSKEALQCVFGDIHWAFATSPWTQVFLNISNTATCPVFCVPFCLCWSTSACIVVTSKVVPVSSLQLSAVVLPPKLLQMVNDSALVQLLNPQWPTPVAQGTPCKETADIPAWPMDSGVGGHLLAVVCWYCMQSDDSTFTYNGYLKYIAKLGGQNVLEISYNFRLKDRNWK